MSKPSFTFDVLRSDAELRVLEPEWLALFAESRTRNPFAHPAWMTTWLRHFVGDEQRRLVVTVRDAGELVAVAPFYRRTLGRGRARAECLQLAGGSPAAHDPLTEMSEVLSLPEWRRPIMRALVRSLTLEHSAGYDWIDLTMPSDHGWFDDEWIPAEWHRRGAFVVHKGVRPFVVLPLPGSWEELHLKRNLREAVRRSKNRHAALDGTAEFLFAEGGEVRDAALAVQALHRRRAEVRDHLPHDDYFQHAAFARFAVDACEGLAATGNASVALCRLDSQPIAGRVVMRAGGSVFLSFSGIDPAYWQLGSATSLVVATIRRGIAAGDDLLNLSVNPDPAKLRWSDRIEIHNEFVIVSPSRRSRAALSLFWQLRSARELSIRRRARSASGSQPPDRQPGGEHVASRRGAYPSNE